MTDIDSMVTFSKQVFEAAEQVVSAMHDGDRMQIKQLAQVVGLALAKDAKEVLGLVNIFAHKTSIAYVTRGKNGGLIRGVKAVKVVKAPKKKAVVAPTLDAVPDGITIVNVE